MSGQTLFCALDVCGALGYNNSRDAMRKHVEIEDVAKRDTMDALGRMQPTTFINESGLYSLILSSKLLNKNTFTEKGCLFSSSVEKM